MYMIIYKTTNLINNKFYIGKDAKNTKSYFGSGKVLKLAIKKYGKENFKKETLKECKTLEELNELEKFYISYFDSTNPKRGYNLTDGGTGGDTWTNNRKDTHWNKGRTPWNLGTAISAEQKQKISDSLKSLNLGANKTSYKPGKDHILYGTKQKQETIDKRKETLKLNGTYENTAKRQMKRVINEDDGKIFDSILSTADYYNLTKDQVGSSCRGKTKKYSFKFV